MLWLCPKFWIKIKLLWFHQDLTLFFARLGHVSNLIILNSTKLSLYTNITSKENQNWHVTSPFEGSTTFFFKYIQSFINVNIFHPLDVCLSSKVVCGAHKHAIKLVFVDSMVSKCLMVLGIDVLKMCIAKTWSVFSILHVQKVVFKLPHPPPQKYLLPFDRLQYLFKKAKHNLPYTWIIYIYYDLTTKCTKHLTCFPGSFVVML